MALAAPPNPRAGLESGLGFALLTIVSGLLYSYSSRARVHSLRSNINFSTKITVLYALDVNRHHANVRFFDKSSVCSVEACVIPQRWKKAKTKKEKKNKLTGCDQEVEL